MLELKNEFLCEVIADLDPPIILANTCHGTRMIFKILGGTVKGPKVNGEILSIGADWFVLRPEGVGELDVRGTMRTDDGQIIHTYYRGILSLTPEVMQRFLTGGPLDPSEYYFRTTPVFETGSEKYKWVNQIVAIGVGTLSKNQVRYKIYQVL